VDAAARDPPATAESFGGTVTPRIRLALVALLAAVYAVCYTAIKAGLAFAPPLRFAALRALIAGGALLLVIGAMRGPSLLPPRRFWRGILALAGTGTVVAYGAMFLSPGRTGAGIASVLGNTTPLIVIGLAAAVLGERVTRTKILAVVLGFAGVSLIAYPSIIGPERAGVLGALLPLLAATGIAGESVLAKRLAIRREILPVVAWQLLIGGAALFLASALIEREVRIAWNGQFAVLLLFLALAGTAFATALWYRLVQDDEVGRLTMLFFLIPVLGLGLAVLVFGERVRVLEAGGIVLALLGVSLVARESWRNASGGTRPISRALADQPCEAWATKDRA
jgi:drug/metabolite transporter (DMT)-like permease